MKKRWLAFFLAAVMCLSVVQTPAYAAEGNDTTLSEKVSGEAGETTAVEPGEESVRPEEVSVTETEAEENIEGSGDAMTVSEKLAETSEEKDNDITTAEEMTMQEVLPEVEALEVVTIAEEQAFEEEDKAGVAEPQQEEAENTKGDVAINAANFPDDNFRSYVSNECDTDGNGTLSTAEISNVLSIDVSSKQISSLKGLEFFSALSELDCSNNQLTALDVSGYSALNRLTCSENRLTVLDVSDCPSLQWLWCDLNQLTALDVSSCPNLFLFTCSENQLTTLDVSRCSHLYRIHCSKNQLTALDVSACPSLGQLSCYSNQIPSLNITHNEKLKTVYTDDRKTDKGDYFAYTGDYYGMYAYDSLLVDKTTEIIIETGEELSWNFDEETGTLTISGTGEMDDYSTSSLAPWYQYKTAITDIVVNEGVTSLGTYAFYRCSHLVNVSLPDSLTSIGNGAFEGCSSLESITIPENVNYLGHEYNASSKGGGFCRTFFGCYALKDIYYSGTEDQWKSITVSEDIIDNEQGWDGGTHSLGELEELGAYVIYHPSQTTLHCSDTVRSYENKGFSYRNSEQDAVSIVITGSGDQWKKHLVIPSEIDGHPVTGIDYIAFCDEDYEGVVIPSGVEDIGFLAFAGCSNLSKMIIEGTSSFFCGMWAPIDAMFLPSNMETLRGNDICSKAIYYAGTEEDWNSRVSIAEGVDLSETRLHYLQEISITSLPDKLIYAIGDELDLTGGALLFTYDDGTQQSFSIEDYMVSGFDSSTEGTKTITVSAGAVTTSFEITVDASLNPVAIASVSVDDVTIAGYSHGEWKETEFGQRWYCYNAVYPSSITVTTSDGESYSGTPDSVREQLNNAYGQVFEQSAGFASEQTDADHFQVGNVYDAVFTLGGMSAAFRVSIEDAPLVVSLEAEDVTIYEGSNGSLVDTDGQKWFFYGVWPKTITAMTVDGEVYTGSVGSVENAIISAYDQWFDSRDNYDFVMEQSYDNQFSAGHSYDAVFTFGDQTATYQVTILPTPIISISAANSSIYEGSNGDQESTYGVSWFCYDAVYPDSISVTTSNGNEYSGSIDSVNSSLKEAYGVWFNSCCYYTVTQSSGAPFVAGNTYGAEIYLGGKTASYEVEIKPLSLIALEASDVTIYEGTNGWSTGSEQKMWFCYNSVAPGSITVTMSDGTSFTGDASSVQSEIQVAYGIQLKAECDYSADQCYTNKFTAGNTYEASITLGGATAAYGVTIEELPVVSVEADDVTVTEGKDGWYETTRHEQKWFRYDLPYPDSVTVTASNGTEYSGTSHEVFEQLSSAYGAEWYSYTYYLVSQSFDNQFSAGNTYEAAFCIGNRVLFTYAVTLEENQIESIQADNITVTEGTNGSLKTDSSGSWYSYSCPWPENMTVTMKDGTAYTGSVSEVKSEIEAYSTWFESACYYADEQSYDHQYTAGNSYEAVFLFAGKSTSYYVTIEEDDSPSCGENLTWSLDEETGTLTISGTGEMKDYSSSSMTPWYKYRTTITNIVVNEGVTSLGTYAFYSCSQLVNVSLPDSLTSIGNAAFEGCSRLESITIPANVNYLGHEWNASYGMGSFCRTFFGCYDLKDIYYLGTEEQWKSITVSEEIIDNEQTWDGEKHRLGELEDKGVYVIYHPSQTMLHCSDTVRRYENKGFLYKEDYRNEGGIMITSPGDYWAKDLIIPSEIDGFPVTGINYVAFNNGDYTSVVIPSSVQFVDFIAFWDCTNLKEVTYKNGSHPGYEDGWFSPFYGITLSTMIIEGTDSFGCYRDAPIDVLFLPANLDTLNPVGKTKAIYYAGTEADWNSRVSIA